VSAGDQLREKRQAREGEEHINEPLGAVATRGTSARHTTRKVRQQVTAPLVSLAHTFLKLRIPCAGCMQPQQRWRVETPEVAENDNDALESVVRIAVRHGFRDPVQAATSGDVVEDLFQECTTRAELVVDRQPRDTRFPGDRVQRETFKALRSAEESAGRVDDALARYAGSGLTERAAIGAGVHALDELI